MSRLPHVTAGTLAIRLIITSVPRRQRVTDTRHPESDVWFFLWDVNVYRRSFIDHAMDACIMQTGVFIRDHAQAKTSPVNF